MKSTLLGYIRSTRKGLYKKIAKEFGVRAWHVYSLAHGKKARYFSDYYILQRLVEEKVISDIKS